MEKLLHLSFPDKLSESLINSQSAVFLFDLLYINLKECLLCKTNSSYFYYTVSFNGSRKERSYKRKIISQ